MTSKQRKTQASNKSVNLGIFEIPNLELKLADSDSDSDESALENELEDILSGRVECALYRSEKKAASPLDIEKVIADCMNDFPDEKENSDDESLLADPDMLKELDELACDDCEEKEEIGDGIREKKISHTPIQKEGRESSPTSPSQEISENIISVLEGRLELYKRALSAATELDDKAKVRRFNRALKTLEELVKSAKSHKLINSEDIPPAVNIPKGNIPPNENPAEPLHNTLNEEHEDTQITSFETAALSAASGPEDPTLFAAPPAPNSVLEALEQRYEKYVSTKSAAEVEGNTSKVRRLQRIVKLYEASLQKFKSGEKIDFGELPTPPGFAAIPISSE